MDVSVIICTRNEGAMLPRTVASVLTATAFPSFEVVVVDDGSTDGSTDALPADARVRLVRGEELGLPAARNLGAAHARGDVVVFLDAHCEVSPNWLDVLTAALDAPDVAVVGPAFTALDSDDPYRGCGMTWVNDRLETAWFAAPGPAAPAEVPFAPGGCQAWRTETFAAVGRFDEGMTRWGFEDIEICLRAWLLGYRVLGAPAATVAHHFRTERAFVVEDEGVLHNYLRMLHLHLAPEREARCTEAVGAYPGLQEAQVLVAAGDAPDLRAELEAVRVRDDGWFLRTFTPHLGVAGVTGRRAGGAPRRAASACASPRGGRGAARRPN